MGKDGLPTVSAFRPRQGENYLSVNWLEFFDTSDLNAAIQLVRTAFDAKGYRVRPNGRFAALNVQDIKCVTRATAERSLSVEHIPLVDDESHAGIFGYTVDDFKIAVEIRALVGLEYTFPAAP